MLTHTKRIDYANALRELSGLCATTAHMASQTLSAAELAAVTREIQTVATTIANEARSSITDEPEAAT